MRTQFFPRTSRQRTAERHAAGKRQRRVVGDRQRIDLDAARDLSGKRSRRERPVAQSHPGRTALCRAAAIGSAGADGAFASQEGSVHCRLRDQLDCACVACRPWQLYTIASTDRLAIAMFVASWCLYHVTEYVGTVTLWSWLGDLTPANIRGQSARPPRVLAHRGAIGRTDRKRRTGRRLGVGDSRRTAMGAARAVGCGRRSDDGRGRCSTGADARHVACAERRATGAVAQHSPRARRSGLFTLVDLHLLVFNCEWLHGDCSGKVFHRCAQHYVSHSTVSARNDACRAIGHCSLGWPIGGPVRQSADHDCFAADRFERDDFLSRCNTGTTMADWRRFPRLVRVRGTQRGAR